MARLKVYRTEQGFFETVVAAPSQAAALEAWGTHQDLFGQGMASVVGDAEAVTAATSRPGVVFRRPIGREGAFKAVDTAAALPRPPKSRPASRADGKATPAPGVGSVRQPPPPDRSALDAAEAEVRAAQARHAADAAEVDRDIAALEDRRRALDRAFRAKLRKLSAARDRAARAFAKAGGRP